MLSRQYSRKVDLYISTSDADGYGGNLISDIAIGSFWAEVKQLSSSKDNAVGVSELKTTYSFKLRKDVLIEQNPNDLSIMYKGVRYIANDIKYDDENFRFVTIIANG